MAMRAMRQDVAGATAPIRLRTERCAPVWPRCDETYGQVDVARGNVYTLII